jgi:O-antigen/teichoic acid export membrane protein
LTQTETTPRSGGTFAYLVGNVIEGAFALLFSIVLVRLISQSDFGGWRQYLIVFGLVSNILIFGLPKSLLYFFSISEKSEKSRVAVRSLLLAAGLGLFSAIVYLVARGLIAEAWSSPALSTYAGLFALYLFLFFPLLIFQPLLLANDNRYKLAIWKIVFATTKLLVLLYIFLTKGTLLNLLIAINIHTAIQLIVSLVMYFKISGVVFSNLWKGSRTQLLYSRDVMLQSLSIVIAREADKIIVSANSTPERFAAYSVGARELPLVDLFPYAIGDSITPELSKFYLERKFKEFLELWHRWMKRVSLLMYPLFAFILFKHQDIIVLLYTKDYIAGAIPFLIFGCLIPLRLTTYNQTLLAMNQSRAVVIGSASGLVLTVVLGFIGIRMVGFIGPALAVLLSEYLVNTYYLTQIRKHLETDWPHMFPWHFLGKVLLLSLVAAGLANVFNVFTCDCSVFMRLLTYGSVFFILFALGVRMLNLITVEDLARLKSSIFRRK